MTEDREPTNNQIGGRDNSNIGDIGEQANVAQGQGSSVGNFNNANITITINEASGLIGRSLDQGAPVYQLLQQLIGSNVRQVDAQKLPTSESIVDELRTPTDESIHPDLIQLVRLLAKDEKTNEGLKGELRQWLNKVSDESEADMAADQNAESNEWVLQVAISNRAEGEDTKEGQNYHLKAWINQEGSTAPAENFHDLKEDETFTFDLLEIGNMVYGLITKANEMGRSISKIEFFLPFEHMIFPVDRSIHHFVIDEAAGRSKILKLINKYPIVVRSENRVFGNIPKSSAYAIGENWQLKWKHLHAHKKSYFLEIDSADPDSAIFDLIDGNETFGCGWLKHDPMMVPDPQELEFMFKDLISFGMPALFWFHQSGLEESDPRSLFDKCCAVFLEKEFKLPTSLEEFFEGADRFDEMIDSVRRSTAARLIPSHVGNHLAVLWDGPDLENMPKQASDFWKKRMKQ